MLLGEARTPAGMRLYAIGDVHGCDDLLAEVHDKIAQDLDSRPPADHRIVHLGDYIDRGNESAAVMERLSHSAAHDERVLCLRGNHETMLIDFLADPVASGAMFLKNGGTATLASYGVSLNRGFSAAGDLIAIADETLDKFPLHHRAFLDALPFSFRFGDFFFCHAGVRPGVPLDAQDPVDLTWIRREFLSSDMDFSAVVIHGHTPMERPEVRPNRINLDTGAVLGGGLTCLALEGSAYRFL